VDTQQYSRQNGSKSLNVIFHGAYAFDQTTQPGRILALIPQMAYHVYRAGSWLAETELRGRTDSEAVVYKLLGVKPGNDTFQPQQNQNLIVKAQRPGNPRAFPFATLVFPLPRKITSLLVAGLPRTAFSHPEELVVSNDSQHIATVQVFTYEIEDQNNLMLKAQNGDGHYWEPVLAGDYVNLHIFAAEDHYHTYSNAEEDFNKCADLIGGLNLKLQTERLPVSRLLDTQPVPGVDFRETESLALRTQRLARLGRLVLQKGGDANMAWFGNDALDGDAEACSGPVS
jgi:hypothetical protein